MRTTPTRGLLALACLAAATLAVTMLGSSRADAQAGGPPRWSVRAGPIPWPIENDSTLRCSLYLPTDRSPGRPVELDVDLRVFVHYTDATGAKVKDRPLSNGVRLPAETSVSIALVQQA